MEMPNPTDPPDWQKRNQGKLVENWKGKDSVKKEQAAGSETVARDQPKPRPKPPTMGRSVDSAEGYRKIDQERVRALARNSHQKAQSDKIKSSKGKEQNREIEK